MKFYNLEEKMLKKTLVFNGLLTLTSPKCFRPTPWLKGHWVNPHPPNLRMAALIKVKCWQLIHVHLRVSQKNFCLYCICIVYAADMTSHENRRFSFQTFLHFLRFIIKSLIHSKLVNLFLSEDCPSLFHFKNINFIVPELLGEIGGSLGTWWEKCQKHPQFP